MTSENCIFGEAMLSQMRLNFPQIKFKLSKKGAVNYQTSGGRWLACCIHGSQVSACNKEGCGSNAYCGCIGPLGGKVMKNRCATHGGASLCQHGNMKNVCKTAPCFGNQLCLVCTTQKSKCLCGTGGHICECGCGKRRSLCATSIAKKEAGELPKRVTKEYLEELEQNFQTEQDRKKYFDEKALKEIYSKCRRDFDTGCLLYDARAPDARGRVLASSMYDGESAVHRIVYRVEVDQDLQPADWVEHSCDNPNCVEKTHLSRKKRNDEGPEYFERRYREVLAAGVRDGDCLLWPYSLSRDGYGRVKVNGSDLLIHRFAYMMANGLKEIPCGLQIRHSHTGNRNCFKDQHLSIGTAEENGDDRIDHGTTNLGEKSWNATVTDDVALEIYQLYGEQTSAQEIADRFNVNVHVVKNIWFKGTYSSATGDVDARSKQREKERLKRKANSDYELTPEDYQNAVERIKKRSTVDPIRGCLRVSCPPKTYPRISIRGKFYFCHRIMFEALKNNCEPIEDEYYVLHTCEERGYDHYNCACIEHLKKGTAKENAVDSSLNDRENIKKVKLMKHELQTGTSAKDVAVKYQKSLSSVYAIRNGTAFSFLDDED